MENSNTSVSKDDDGATAVVTTNDKRYTARYDDVSESVFLVESPHASVQTKNSVQSVDPQPSADQITTQGFEIITSNVIYRKRIYGQCHVSRCSSNDHLIAGNAFRLQRDVAAFTQGALGAAITALLAGAAPPAILAAAPSGLGAAAVAEGIVAVVVARLSDNEFSIAGYDYDIGGFGVYTPASQVGVSNNWKATKRALIPTNPPLRDFHLADSQLTC